jgi:hypothetical protein
MSEVKVNKISPRAACGTVQLGDSGDTFTIPAGASITNSGTASGFGATGSASWNTTVKTGDFTAVAGEGYFVNTTSGEVDVTLPAGTAGAVVAVKDYAKTWDTNNCILISNGSEKIGGSTNNAVLSTEGLSVTLVYIDSTQGWLVTDDGLQSVANTNPFIEATGGTITTSGNCKIHTFTGPGTFTVCKAANCSTNNIVSHLVVAGGGGGGECRAGGGGAGGFREVKNPVTPYTASPLDGYPSAPNRVTVTATAYPIIVGAGGAGSTDRTVAGVSGSVSTFSTITSAGGGGGGGDGSPGTPSGQGDGNPGGSGGGASNSGTKGSGNTPPTTPAQGSDGGCSTSGWTGSGGGGAGGAGTTAGPCCSPGPGGAGIATLINPATGEAGPGPSQYYAGGGGGGGAQQSGPGAPAGTGGVGGGGDGTGPGDSTGGAGVANTGGGGGGNGGPAGSGAGGTGGSGIVIIRYKFQ